MDQIKKDVMKLVKRHSLLSVSTLMVEYYQETGRHLYLEAKNLGYRSVHHFLTYFDELTVEMDFMHTFDIHVRLDKAIKIEKDTESNNNQIIVKTEKLDENPGEKTKPITQEIRSYTSVNGSSKPKEKSSQICNEWEEDDTPSNPSEGSRQITSPSSNNTGQSSNNPDTSLTKVNNDGTRVSSTACVSSSSGSTGLKRKNVNDNKRGGTMAKRPRYQDSNVRYFNNQSSAIYNVQSQSINYWNWTGGYGYNYNGATRSAASESFYTHNIGTNYTNPWCNRPSSYYANNASARNNNNNLFTSYWNQYGQMNRR